MSGDTPEPSFFLPADGPDSDKDVRRPASLSERETNILMCLAQGLANKMIARQMGIAESTVKVHVKSLLRKIRVSNRTQAATWAISHGLVDAQGRPTEAGASLLQPQLFENSASSPSPLTDVRQLKTFLEKDPGALFERITIEEVVDLLRGMGIFMRGAAAHAQNRLQELKSAVLKEVGPIPLIASAISVRAEAREGIDTPNGQSLPIGNGHE
jgi:DNA-binding CsgD family transcriptional regulator